MRKSKHKKSAAKALAGTTNRPRGTRPKPLPVDPAKRAKRRLAQAKRMLAEKFNGLNKQMEARIAALEGGTWPTYPPVPTTPDAADGATTANA